MSDDYLNINSDFVVGTCMMMCPQKESERRLCSKQINFFERAKNIPSFKNGSVEFFFIKEYVRSSADQSFPELDQLRPPDILLQTVDFLMNNIVPLYTKKETDLSTWFQFIWDRFRSIAKDIIQQNIKSPTVCTVLEKMIRFHIFCQAFLKIKLIDEFDTSLNLGSLMSCLDLLYDIYENTHIMKIRPIINFVEFSIYRIVLNFYSDEISVFLRKYSDILSPYNVYGMVLEMFRTVKLRLFTEFFDLLVEAPILIICVFYPFLEKVTKKALKSICFSHHDGSSGPIFLDYNFFISAMGFDYDEGIKFFESNNIHYSLKESIDSSTLILPSEMGKLRRKLIFNRGEESFIFEMLVEINDIKKLLNSPDEICQFEEIDANEIENKIKNKDVINKCYDPDKTSCLNSKIEQDNFKNVQNEVEKQVCIKEDTFLDVFKQDEDILNLKATYGKQTLENVNDYQNKEINNYWNSSINENVQNNEFAVQNNIQFNNNQVQNSFQNQNEISNIKNYTPTINLNPQGDFNFTNYTQPENNIQYTNTQVANKCYNFQNNQSFYPNTNQFINNTPNMDTFDIFKINNSINNNNSSISKFDTNSNSFCVSNDLVMFTESNLKTPNLYESFYKIVDNNYDSQSPKKDDIKGILETNILHENFYKKNNVEKNNENANYNDQSSFLLESDKVNAIKEYNCIKGNSIFSYDDFTLKSLSNLCKRKKRFLAKTSEESRRILYQFIHDSINEIILDIAKDTLSWFQTYDDNFIKHISNTMNTKLKMQFDIFISKYSIITLKKPLPISTIVYYEYLIVIDSIIYTPTNSISKIGFSEYLRFIYMLLFCPNTFSYYRSTEAFLSISLSTNNSVKISHEKLKYPEAYPMILKCVSVNEFLETATLKNNHQKVLFILSEYTLKSKAFGRIKKKYSTLRPLDRISVFALTINCLEKINLNESYMFYHCSKLIQNLLLEPTQGPLLVNYISYVESYTLKAINLSKKWSFVNQDEGLVNFAEFKVLYDIHKGMLLQLDKISKDERFNFFYERFSKYELFDEDTSEMFELYYKQLNEPGDKYYDIEIFKTLETERFCRYKTEEECKISLERIMKVLGCIVETKEYYTCFHNTYVINYKSLYVDNFKSFITKSLTNKKTIIPSVLLKEKSLEEVDLIFMINKILSENSHVKKQICEKDEKQRKRKLAIYVDRELDLIMKRFNVLV